MSWRILPFSLPFDFDHGDILAGLDVLGVEAPLLELRLVLLLTGIVMAFSISV